MPTDVYALTQGNFRSQIDAVGDAILRVTEGLDTQMPGSIVTYFDEEYPGAFAYLTIRREAIQIQEWWNKNFVNGSSPMPRYRRAGSPGYYLFVKGVPVEWIASPARDALADAAVDLLVFGLTNGDPKARNTTQNERDKQNSKPVIEHFERYLRGDAPAMRHIQVKASSGRAAKKAEQEDALRRLRDLLNKHKNPGASSPPPKPKTEAAPEDPYKVLGITRHTPPDEIKRAMKARRVESHPDKVAHMAPPVRAAAEAEFKRVEAAISKIKADLGW